MPAYDDTIPTHQFQYRGSFAADYETHRQSDKKWRRENEIVADYLDIATRKGSLILDVPVGTGRFFPEYSKRNLNVIGIDVSVDMLNIARSAIGTHGCPGTSTNLQVGNITHLPIKDKSIDLVICIRLLNLVSLDTLRKSLHEIGRVSTDYVVIGVRTHTRRGSVRRSASRMRSILRRQIEKLIIHSKHDLDNAISDAGMELVRRSLVSQSAGHSSQYDIYLLRPSNK